MATFFYLFFIICDKNDRFFLQKKKIRNFRIFNHLRIIINDDYPKLDFVQIIYIQTIHHHLFHPIEMLNVLNSYDDVKDKC